MTTTELKTACLTWLRYGRQMPYVAEEIGPWNWLADVAGADDAQLVEIEVKTSVADLRRDFEAKTSKHHRYLSLPGHEGWLPNKMYFAVPAKLADATRAVLAEKAPAYGMIIGLDLAGDFSLAPWKRLSIAKSAKPIHLRPPSPAIKNLFLKRMGSDLCHFHMMRQHYGGLFDHLQGLSKTLAEAGANDILAP